MSTVSTRTILFSFLFVQATAFAQPNNGFKGVYRLEGPAEFYILFKPSGRELTGYMIDPEKAVLIKGEDKGNGMEVRFAEGQDTTVNYVTIDPLGNLALSDGNHISVTFRRTALNADSLFFVIDKAKQENRAPSGSSTALLPAQYAGKKFLHLYTGNGYTEKWAYYLYADGTFRFKGDNSYVSSGASGDFSGATAATDTGTWEVIMDNSSEILLLKWKDASAKRLRIMRTSNGYELNGVRYFLVAHSEYE